MKTILAVLLLVPIQAFSMTPEQFKKSYREIELEQAPKIEACKNHIHNSGIQILTNMQQNLKKS